MKKSYQAVILHPDTPQSLLEGLKNYIFEAKGLSFLISSRVVSVEWPMASMGIERKGIKKDTWEVQIPVSYIMMIGSVANKETGIGFIN